MPVEPFAIDLSTPTRIHVVGVGGAGMSAIALVLAQMGHRVSGSDLRSSPAVERLRRSGVDVVIGHTAGNLGDARLVTASPAVDPSNPELVAAREVGARFAPRAEMMGALAAMRSTLAVAGTHGKTTTSSMLSLIMIAAGLEPSFLIGADVAGPGVNAVWGAGEHLVIEADESYGSFAVLEPTITVLTNVEPDHLDHYGTVEGLEAAFEALLRRSAHGAAVMADDPGAARIGERVEALRVGIGDNVDLAITSVETNRSSSKFTLELPVGCPLSLTIGAPGLHNVRNASMAAVGAALAGASPESISDGLSRFAGVPRRFEFRGEADGITFVDDYAHLPTEVAATLEATGSGGFARVIAVFQPHRFTRTQAVAPSFAESFKGAAHVVVTDIYSAGEAPIAGVSGQLVADAVRLGTPDIPVTYVTDRADLVEVVNALLLPGDLCLTMGAGDLTTLPDEIIEHRR